MFNNSDNAEEGVSLDGHQSVGKALPCETADQASQAVLQGLHNDAQTAVDASVARVAVLAGGKDGTGNSGQHPLDACNSGTEARIVLDMDDGVTGNLAKHSLTFDKANRRPHILPLSFGTRFVLDA